MSNKRAMAQRYREYVQGWAYIPIQDLPKYEKAFKEVININ
jgi:hypothetical protein